MSWTTDNGPPGTLTLVGSETGYLGDIPRMEAVLRFEAGGESRAFLDAFALTGPDGRLYLSGRPGTVGGHRGSKLYGRLDCRAALQAIERGGYVRHRVFFADEPTAKAAGYRPCAVCMPQQHAAWKAS